MPPVPESLRLESSQAFLFARQDRQVSVVFVAVAAVKHFDTKTCSEAYIYIAARYLIKRDVEIGRHRGAVVEFDFGCYLVPSSDKESRDARYGFGRTAFHAFRIGEPRRLSKT